MCHSVILPFPASRRFDQMLSQPIATTPHIIQDYCSHLVSRQKVSPDPSFYSDFVNASPIGSPAGTVDEERIASPYPSGIYDYAFNSFDFQLSAAEIYRNPQNQPFDTNQYPNTHDSVQQSHNINTSASARQSRSMNSYLWNPRLHSRFHICIASFHPTSIAGMILPFGCGPIPCCRRSRVTWTQEIISRARF